MKILDQIQLIFNKYELHSIILPDGYKNIYSFLKEYPEFSEDFKTEKDDSYFIEKYKQHIPPCHYGISIGSPIISTWNDILDEIIELCIKNDPKFEIHQIKLKFGGIRFYVNSNVIEDISDVEELIESTLYDNALIY